MGDRLELATFEPHVGEPFTAHVEDAGAVELTLSEANRGPWQPHEGPATAFELMFLGPPDPVLPQGTYRLTHGSLGDLEIFVVPIARSGDGTTYHAVFN